VLGVAVVVLLVVGFLMLRPGGGGGGTGTAASPQLSDRVALVPVRVSTGKFVRLMEFDTDTHERKPWAGAADALKGGSTDDDVDRFSATPSPDRTQVAYLEGAHEGLPVPYVADPDGTGAHPLMTSQDAPCANTKRPAWSPDGQRMAVVCIFDDQSWSLWLVDARDGTGLKVLVARQYDWELGAPSWDAAGHTVYTWEAQPPPPHSLPGTKGRLVSLTDEIDRPKVQRVPGVSDDRYTEPDWAAPGLLSVHRAGGEANEVVVVHGDEVTKVAEGPYLNASWSPDHRSILATLDSGKKGVQLVVLPYPRDDASAKRTGVFGNFGAPNWGTR
jgi:Tol biopolymer transport system component